MTLIAAIDAGASEVKACVFDTEGREVSRASRECHSDSPQPGWAEGPAEILLTWPQEVLREAVARSGASPAEVAAIGVTGSRATIFPVRTDGQPTGPIIYWHDRRAKAEVDAFVTQIGADKFFELTGVPLDLTPSIAKLLWLRENAGDIFAKADIFAAPQSVILNTLAGSGWYCDISYGSYYGLMSLDSLAWSDDLLRAAGIGSERLPELIQPGTCVGGLTDGAARTTGLRPGTPVVASGSDAACSKLGGRTTREGIASLYIGTAGAIGVISRKRVSDRRLTCCAAAMPGYWDNDALLLSGGSVYRWLRDLIGGAGVKPSFADLDRLAAQTSAGSEGLLLVPYLAGAGSPLWDAETDGKLLGLRLSHGLPHLARAVLEGVSYSYRHALDALQDAIGPVRELQLNGGGSTPLWAQILADITNLPACVQASRESTALGAAVMAGAAVGVFQDPATAIEAMDLSETLYLPSSDSSIYQERYQTYLQNLPVRSSRR